MFCTCSGRTKGPASSTRMRRLRVASVTKRCSATTEPNVPPPMTMTSKSRLRPPTVTAALSNASCKVLQRKRPWLSRVKVVLCTPISFGPSINSLIIVCPPELLDLNGDCFQETPSQVRFF